MGFRERRVAELTRENERLRAAYTEFLNGTNNTLLSAERVLNEEVQ